MSDSISRQAAIRWVKTECNPYGKPTLDYDSGLKVIEHLKKMPSEEAVTKCIAQIKVDTEEVARRIKEEYDITDGWIPCGERLPRTGDDILVTYSDGEVDIIWSARPKAWVRYIESNNLIYPIAWMPLPKPYKEDGEQE